MNGVDVRLERRLRLSFVNRSHWKSGAISTTRQLPFKGFVSSLDKAVFVPLFALHSMIYTFLHCGPVQC